MSFDKDRILDAMTGRYVDFYRQFTELRPDGGQFRGPCPRHGGDGPNFTVAPDAGHWYCHSGCQEGGDVFQFVQKMMGLTFPETLQWLADWLRLSDTTPAVRKPFLPKPTPLYLDPALAADAHARLMDTDKARVWLAEHRGLTTETVTRFQVGLLPATDKGDGPRLTLPVYDADGRLVNIRTYLPPYKHLTDERRREMGKVKNWQAGLITGGLFPLSALEGAQDVLLLEGETDALLANQTGFAAVTGTGGAGYWKPENADALRGKRVTVLYDRDDAGQKGGQKAAAALLSAGVSVSVASYPEGVKDFTEWVVENSATAEDVRRVIAEAVPFVPTIPTESTPPPGIVGTVGTIRTVSEWETPVPLGVTALPPFPVEALPPVLATYVTEIAQTTVVDAGMPAVLALAVVAAAGGRRCIVQVGETHAEPLNLFCAVVAAPGGRKSSVVSAIDFPLHEYETALTQSVAADVESAKARRAIEDKRLAHLQDMAAKAKNADERANLTHEAEVLAGELTSVPSLPRLLADNVTPERLTGIMADNDGACAIFSPEGGIFSILAGKYSNKDADVDLVLKGHAGDSVRVDRVGRPSEFINRPALTMGLAVQPDVLASFSNTPAFRGRGLLGRFLYAIPPDLTGTRTYKNSKPDPEARRRYALAIERILDLPSAGTEEDPSLRHSLLLTGDALTLWAEYADAVEARQAEGEDLSGVKDWASKLAGAVARIAGGFHLVENAGGNWQKPISAETVAAAWAVGEYFIPHALAAFGQMSADPRLVLARRILRWIERKGLTAFTLRECHNAHTGGGGLTSEEVEKALSVLVDRGYVRTEARPERPEGVGGRQKSQPYTVNPCVLTDAERAGNL